MSRICSLGEWGGKKIKPEECLGCDKDPTPSFPKTEEEIGRACQIILFKLIQILEGVDTAMQCWTPLPKHTGLSRKAYTAAACARYASACSWDKNNPWCQGQAKFSSSWGKNLKAIYAVLNQTTDSERALHEVKRVFYLVQIGLLTPWKDFGKNRCPTHKSSKSGNKVWILPSSLLSLGPASSKPKPKRSESFFSLKEGTVDFIGWGGFASEVSSSDISERSSRTGNSS